VLTDKGIAEGVWYNLHWKPRCAVSDLNSTTADGGIFPTERPFFVVSTATPNMATISVLNPDVAGAPWTLIGNDCVVWCNC
jgi:hypothetical protein